MRDAGIWEKGRGRAYIAPEMRRTRGSGLGKEAGMRFVSTDREKQGNRKKPALLMKEERRETQKNSLQGRLGKKREKKNTFIARRPCLTADWTRNKEKLERRNALDS